MIRPLTIVTLLMAGGSGLYLYQSKHEVQLLDRTIERIVRDTGALREQSRLLAAEWTMLNDPERLRQFSDTYLTLKTIAPTQFTSVADLGNHLPPPQPAVAPQAPDRPETAPETVSSSDPEPLQPETPSTAAIPPAAVADHALPIPPIPAAHAAVAAGAVSHPSDTRITERPPSVRPLASDGQTRSTVAAVAHPYEPISRPMLADVPAHPVVVSTGRPYDQRPIDQHPPEQHAADPHAVSRVADARTTPTQPSHQVVYAPQRPPLPSGAPVSGPPPIAPYQQQPAVALSAPYGGSLLGMARGSMPSAPRPTPVTATYNAN